MKLEVIIPIRNCPALFMRMLSHVMNQIQAVNAKYGDHSVGLCVVDDASTDETPDNVENFIGENKNDFRLVRNTKHTFAGGARNSGISSSSSEWFAFFDADDDIAKDALDKIVNAINENEGTDAVLWGMKTLKENNCGYEWLPNYKHLEQEYPLAPPSPCIKAIRKDKIFNFPTDMYCEDGTWWFPQADKLERVCAINETLYIYDRRHKSSTTDIMDFVDHPKTLEDLAFNDVLVEAGGNDRIPSDALRNLANLYDMRSFLHKACVKNAWRSRFQSVNRSLMAGIWTY